MIFDHRTYNIKPNRLATFLETFERLALPVQREYLGEPYGFFATHIGPMSRVVHLWQYENLADRELRRDAMESASVWQSYRRVALEEDTTHTDAAVSDAIQNTYVRIRQAIEQAAQSTAEKTKGG